MAFGDASQRTFLAWELLLLPPGRPATIRPACRVPFRTTPPLQIRLGGCHVTIRTCAMDMGMACHARYRLR